MHKERDASWSHEASRDSLAAVTAPGVALAVLTASNADATASQSARTAVPTSAGIPNVTAKPVPLAARNPKLPDVVVVDAGGTITSTAQCSDREGSPGRSSGRLDAQ
ncbi:hypothetical protein ACWGJB_39635 [Streptomyces sp. NPDC054813]